MQKDIERASRPKRVYRKRLWAPSDQEDTKPILVDPAFESEDSKARTPSPSMGGFLYPTGECSLIFPIGITANNAHG